MGNQYAMSAKFSRTLGAFVFYPNFFSNGTYGAGVVANYESISSIIDTKYNLKTASCRLAWQVKLEATEIGITWAIRKLASAGLSGTILDCPTSAISPNFLFYPNSTRTGGSLKPPPRVAANTGNKVYNKKYFSGAPPTEPKCNHVS